MHKSAPVQVKIVDRIGFNDNLFYHRGMNEKHLVRRSSQGDRPTAGRPQGYAPTMDEPGKALRGHRGDPHRATTPPQGEDKPSPLLWTSLARRFVGIEAILTGRPQGYAPT